MQGKIYKKSEMAEILFSPLPKKILDLTPGRGKKGGKRKPKAEVKKRESLFPFRRNVKKLLSYDRRVMGAFVQIEIPGKPIAKKRPRFARRGKFVITYNPQQTEESRFLFEIQKQWKRNPLENPIKIVMFFYMPIPKSTYSSKRKLMERGWIRHTKRPDLDNLVKFAKDCLNGVVYRDDSQVYAIQAEKRYSDDPKTEILISWVERLTDGSPRAEGSLS